MQSWTLSKLNSSLDLPSHHCPSLRSLRQTQTPTCGVHHRTGGMPSIITNPIPSIFNIPPPWSIQGIEFINPKWSWWCWVSHLQISPRLCLPLLLIGKGASKDSSRAETCMPGAAVSASEPKLWWSYLQLTGKKIHEFGRVFPQNRRSHVVNPTINLRASDFRDDYLPPFSDKIADGLLIQCGLLPYLGMGQVETNMNMMVLTHSYVCV